MKSGCRCGVRYTRQAHRYRVLRRAGGDLKANRLYCLDCRAEWNSNAWYCALLSDHVKESRSGLTDADVLDCLIDGRLVVDPDTATVTNAKGFRLSIEHRTHPKGEQKGTYRFVNVCSGGRKKKIALHRLVWMDVHRELIPEGYDIDHIVSQDDDTIGNLQLMPSDENRRRGAAKAVANRKAETPF